MRKVYRIENLDCANCAAKIERKLAQLPGVQEVSIVFATKQLRITAADPDALLPEIRAAAAALEPDVTISPKEKSAPAADQASPHQQGCACDHAHDTLSGGNHPHGQLHSMPKGAAKKAQAAPGARENKNTMPPEKRSLVEISISAMLFILAQFFDILPKTAEAIVFVVAYLIVGGRVVRTAAANLSRGQVFDENFLMSIATLGAFAIQEYPEAVGVMLFYRVGEYFEHKAVEKSRNQIMQAVDLRPEVVNILRGETVSAIDAEDAKVGDLLLVRPGDRIPLDGVIDSGTSRIDTSPVTGEPVPVKVGPGDKVVSGCVNTSGALHLRVEKVLAESMVTRILESVENAAAGKPKIDRFITRFARIYTPFVVASAALIAVVPSLVTGDWNYWIYTALTFLVISCPCALVLSVPLAFFSGIGAGSKKGILFKGGASIEAIRRVKAVVMDKTGTITEGNFVVQAIVPAGEETEDSLLALCAACESASNHPIAVSIVQAAEERGVLPERPLAIEEIAGKGIRATLPSGVALCGSRGLLEYHDVSLGDCQNDARGTMVFVARGGRYIGHIAIADTVKADAASAIAAIKRLGIKTAMLTGDSESSAAAAAEQTGIEDVRARLLPEDKLTELKRIRARYGRVMFVGDGINDAPVLAGADVGAAMGSGADAAIEAADVVFMTSKVEAIPQAIAIAGDTSQIAWQNVAVALAVKFLVMIMGLAGHASMWLAVFADTGVAMLCVLNSVRILYKKS